MADYFRTHRISRVQPGVFLYVETLVFVAGHCQPQQPTQHPQQQEEDAPSVVPQASSRNILLQGLQSQSFGGATGAREDHSVM